MNCMLPRNMLKIGHFFHAQTKCLKSLVPILDNECRQPDTPLSPKVWGVVGRRSPNRRSSRNALTERDVHPRREQQIGEPQADADQHLLHVPEQKAMQGLSH